MPDGGSLAISRGHGTWRIECRIDGRLLICPCSLRIHTSCQHILNSMQNSWARQWQKNGWKTAKGREVRNTDLWARIMGQLDRHLYTFTDGEHTYSGWMEGQLKPDGRKRG